MGGIQASKWGLLVLWKGLSLEFFFFSRTTDIYFIATPFCCTAFPRAKNGITNFACSVLWKLLSGVNSMFYLNIWTPHQSQREFLWNNTCWHYIMLFILDSLSAFWMSSFGSVHPVAPIIPPSRITDRRPYTNSLNCSSEAFIHWKWQTSE